MNISSQSRSNAFLMAAALLLTAVAFSNQAWSEDAPKAEQRVEPRPHGGGGYGNRDNNWAPNRAAPAPRGAPAIQGGEHFDRDRYHPPVGAGFDRLPQGYQRYGYRGEPYYFRGGIWYRHGGPGYTVVRPPRGLLIYSLPPFFVTRWYGGIPYYYYDDTYYLWDSTQRGYVVTDPPGSVATNAPDGASNDIFVYPMQSQSPDQQAKDRYDCYRWAADQTGFDPTKPEGGVDSGAADRRADYRRAETACLTGRGYSVK